MQSGSVTAALAAFAAQLRPSGLPADVREQVRRALLDTVAVMLAGAAEPCARIVARYAAALQARPEATVVGSSLRTAAAEAALVNGTAAHALDYDDVNEAMMGHPSAPLVPAVLAVAERTDASGAEAVTAYAAGFEVQARVGRMLGPAHYARGWHPTATLGTLGAAVAAGRLLGLDERGMAMALGIATSLAAGCRQQFGTMTKPLHAGLAARNGVTAALLAAEGMMADASALEAPLGFARLYSEGADPERALRGLGETWTVLDPGIGVKKYPCCDLTHCAVDAALQLRSAHGEAAASARSVEVLVPQGALAPLIHERPSTGLEAKFSMSYCVAAALVDGEVRLATFTDDAVGRQEVRALMERVRLREEARRAGAGSPFYAEVALDLGETEARAFVDVPRGDARRPLTWEELEGKFRDCAGALPGHRVERCLRWIAGLDELPRVADLMAEFALQA